MQETILHVRI